MSVLFGSTRHIFTILAGFFTVVNSDFIHEIMLIHPVFAAATASRLSESTAGPFRLFSTMPHERSTRTIRCRSSSCSHQALMRLNSVGEQFLSSRAENITVEKHYAQQYPSDPQWVHSVSDCPLSPSITLNGNGNTLPLIMG